MFGNDPRLPGARNAVPGSQNGVYSGLCLKMTLEVCLKMTPLPTAQVSTDRFQMQRSPIKSAEKHIESHTHTHM